MHCSVVTTTSPDVLSAVSGLCDRLRAGLEGHTPDLVVVFYTTHHTGDAAELRERLQSLLEPELLLGCPAAGVIGGGMEIEGRAGLTVWAAHWPGARLQPFRLGIDDVNGAPALVGWPTDVPEGAGFIVLADPYTTPSDDLLSGFAERYPGSAVAGGMASGAQGPGHAHLLTTDAVQQEGCIGVVIDGAVRMDVVVSQGCRPVGKHFVVTKGSRNVIYTLGGKPAFECLKSILEEVDEKDRALIQQGAIHVGRVVDERRSSFERGDFLVRNIMGIDPDAGAIAISEQVRTGITIQFMVRDGDAASEELNDLLEKEATRGAVLGSMLFSCNGRGVRLFGRPNHDIACLHDALGDVPTAGFFAAGEIGPVCGRPFLHGFTASIALFRKNTPD